MTHPPTMSPESQQNEIGFKMFMMDNKIPDSQGTIDYGTWRKMPQYKHQVSFEKKTLSE